MTLLENIFPLLSILRSTINKVCSDAISSPQNQRNISGNWKYYIPAKRSASVRAWGALDSSYIWLLFLVDGLFLNILSIENDDEKSIV